MVTVWKGDNIKEYVGTPPEVDIEKHYIKLQISEIKRIPDHADVIIDNGGGVIKSSFDFVNPDDGYYNLPRGMYRVSTANKIKIPSKDNVDTVGVLQPEETLSKYGIIKEESRILETGYEGHPEVVVSVNTKSLKIAENEFWFNLIFMDAESV